MTDRSRSVAARAIASDPCPRSRPSGRRRHRVLGGATAVLFAALIARMWYLQVVSSATYDDVAAGNRIRLVQTDAPRGRILDAEGRAVADTRPALSLALDVGEVSELNPTARHGLFDALAGELAQAGHEVGAGEMARRYEAALGRSLQPIVLIEEITPGLWITLSERDYAGVRVEERWRRSYPYGTVAAHVIGHLGTVDDAAEADRLGLAPGAERKPYQPGDVVGRAGLELLFETQLRGTPEIRRVEIDADNRVVGTVEIVQPAAPGDDIHLTIDLDLQMAAERILEQRLLETRSAAAPSKEAGCERCPSLDAPAGSFVALRPDDGTVVALASHPAFDPRWFIDGLTASQADALFRADDHPLVNRAIAGEYPAGSTFKPVTAYAALRNEVRAAGDIWIDRGRHLLTGCAAAGDGCEFRNAGSVALGAVDLPRAIARSSDTYFYSLGETLWNERSRHGETPIQDTARRLGLGSATGIDLPGERAGLVPTPAGRALDRRNWYTGDNVNLAIGQGDLLVTPLQLANAYASLARGGERFVPRLVDRITDGASGALVVASEPRRAAPADLDPVLLGPIRDGLLAAPHSGTATAAFAGFPLDRYPVAGKTGTAQVAGRADFALFAGYGPHPAADYAFAVVLEEAGYGGVAAAPAARAFLEIALGLDGTTTGEAASETADRVGHPGRSGVLP